MPDRLGMVMSANGQEAPQDPAITAKIELIHKYWESARTLRYNFEVQWQETSLLIWPEMANTFFYGYDQWPGQKKTAQQVDATGMVALERFGAIIDSITTPFVDPWSKLEIKTDDRALKRSRRVKSYFNKLSCALWDARYAETANFQSQNQQNYWCLGAFGNMHMFIDELDTRFYRGTRGLRYKSISPGEVYLLQNHQGLVDSYFRAFRWTARQIWQRWPDTFPATLKSALELGSQTKYWVLEYVFPRADDFLPWRVDNKAMPYGSYYISIEGHVLLEESGYHSFPLPTGRYTQATDEVYGRGPAQKVLPALKTLNAEKVVFLKQGHRAADPIYLTFDDTINFKSAPGSWNPGMMTKDGKRLVDILPTGSIQIDQEMMAEERNLIKDEFLVSLFQMAWENPNAAQRSAREVVEFINDRGMLLAPTVGRQFSEYLGPLIHRELAVLARLGLLPDLPPELREAGGEYKVVFTSPLARALRASKTAGFMRLVEMLGTVAQQTGKPDATDIVTLAFNRSLPDIAEDQGVDEDWLATPQEMAQAAQQRAKEADREAQIKAMPAQAAIMKAQAITAKAQTGGNTGGTLSGVPQGQMPQIPGNPSGVPGQPGVNGQPGTPGLPAPGGQP